MRARAPGKLVLSGAYAVLSGARALVAAVDRYVIADCSRAAERVTPEVAAALGQRAAPWFDASPLREGERKLGLGSSAAILVASLGALELEQEPALSLAELHRRVYEPARRAHRQAQGGGSGLDVAASVFGGVLLATPVGESGRSPAAAHEPCASGRSPAAAHQPGDELELCAVELPAELHVRVLASPEPASTPALLARVRELAARDASTHRYWLARQSDASERAADAVLRGDAAALLAALRDQAAALTGLGEAAGIPIVTPAVARLAREAAQRQAAALPAGAGGGDVALWLSQGPSELPDVSGELSEVELRLGAAGLSRAPV